MRVLVAARISVQLYLRIYRNMGTEGENGLLISNSR